MSEYDDLVAKIKAMDNEIDRLSRITPRTQVDVKAYTIDAGGEITLTGYAKIRYITIDTYSGGATDDLDTINGGTTGDILICNSANAARDPTFKDATGNLQLAGDFTCTTAGDTIMLIYSGTNWREVSRSDNS